MAAALLGTDLARAGAMQCPRDLTARSSSSENFTIELTTDVVRNSPSASMRRDVRETTSSM